MGRNDPTNSLLEAPSFRVGSHQFTKVKVVKIHKKTCDVVFERGNVASMGILHEDITQLGEVEP